MNPRDFIMDGIAHGDVANLMLQNGFNTSVLRPYLIGNKSYVTNTGNDGKPRAQLVTNATATLFDKEWVQIDQAVVRTARPELRAWTDLQNAGLTYNIPNGMGKTILQYQTMTDAGQAILSMDGMRQSQRDRPETDLKFMPLPIVHEDFSFSAREIAVSRNMGSPLDTTMAEQATRRCMEVVEKLTLGLMPYAYNGGNVYGYTNFPGRQSFTITSPTAPGWTPAQTLNDVLVMKRLSRAVFQNGPWMVYMSPDWDTVLDEDYSPAKGDNSLRERIGAIDRISGIRSLDYLTGYQILMVQMTSGTVRAITGMPLTTLQWPGSGGMQFNFKVMAIMVPQVRASATDQSGIIHGTV